VRGSVGWNEGELFCARWQTCQGLRTACAKSQRTWPWHCLNQGRSECLLLRAGARLKLFGSAYQPCILLMRLLC
jgi:hypothetical protein